MDAPVENIMQIVNKKINQLDTEDGILFIMDVFGGTLGNITRQAAEIYHAEMLSGVNLPMVICMLNYRDQPVQSLLDKTVENAQSGIQLQ